ncbi:MAG: hypothetical protein ACPMAQ_09815 [Phycisphaerae bacterium]
MRTLFGMLTATSLAAATAAAGEPKNHHVWKPDVRSVAVFKNGMGFFVRDGDVALRDGWCMAGTVPPAVFGTFAVYSLREDQSVDIVGAGPGETVEFNGKDGPDDLPGKRARLEGCKGLQVTLTTEHDGKSRTSTGTVVELTGEFAILNQDGQLHAARLSELKKLQVLDYPLRVHVEGKGTEGEPARLGMAYLRKGVTWVPEYTLRILDENTAELTLRATLINEADDLIHTDVHFVVGVPNFLHSEYLTPIAVGQAIRTVAAALPAGFQSQMVSNALMNRAAVAADSRATPAEPRPASAPESGGNIEDVMRSLPQTGGEAASDFAVYTKQAMTVRRGEKAVVTLFRCRIPYSHYYRWQSPGDLRHFLVLRNETDTPWTTGPVVAVSEQRPLCEDTVRYTPRGSAYELPVTTAVNVATGATESEADRKLKAHEPAQNVFLDLVTVEGRLTIRNHEKRPIELEVRRTVAGLVELASDDGRIWQNTEKLKLTAREGTVTWALKLAPGEAKELTYRYERYVPSN